MSFKLFFSPDAKEDLQEIYDWYVTKLPDLGERFIDEVEKRLFLLAHTRTWINQIRSYPLYNGS